MYFKILIFYRLLLKKTENKFFNYIYISYKYIIYIHIIVVVNATRDYISVNMYVTVKCILQQ